MLPRPAADPWCSGPTCQPVTLEIAGSNPVGSAIIECTHAPSARPDGASFCPRRAGSHPVCPRTRHGIIGPVKRVPVIAVGRLGDPAIATEAVAAGKADFIALGRALIA